MCGRMKRGRVPLQAIPAPPNAALPQLQSTANRPPIPAHPPDKPASTTPATHPQARISTPQKPTHFAIAYSDPRPSGASSRSSAAVSTPTASLPALQTPAATYPDDPKHNDSPHWHRLVNAVSSPDPYRQQSARLFPKTRASVDGYQFPPYPDPKTPQTDPPSSIGKESFAKVAPARAHIQPLCKDLPHYLHRSVALPHHPIKWKQVREAPEARFDPHRRAMVS